MNAPQPYTPTPGGRYLIGPDGQRVQLDEATGLPPAAAPTPTPAAAPAAAPATPKPASKE